MDHDDVLVQVDLALTSVKRGERDLRLAKQTLARLRDTLQPAGHKEHDDRDAADPAEGRQP